LNLHLEAFSEENRELHLHRLNERILELKPDVCGGDFNGTIGLRESLTGEFLATPAPAPTFPAPAPLSVLDGFILKKDRVRSHRLQVPDTGTFSDHFPVLLELEIQS
jgi:endonuclease/exonuclease/phosphatase family metal-dependent hydrolase